MTHRPNEQCVECGISHTDGYVIGCRTCQERRSRRLRRGNQYTPSGYPGELIDNRDPRGRIVVA